MIKIKCKACESTAVSVCNFDHNDFQGCKKPFCASHGLFHLNQGYWLNDLSTVLESRRKKLEKFNSVFDEDVFDYVRVCDDCFPML